MEEVTRTCSHLVHCQGYGSNRPAGWLEVAGLWTEQFILPGLQLGMERQLAGFREIMLERSQLLLWPHVSLLHWKREQFVLPEYQLELERQIAGLCDLNAGARFVAPLATRLLVALDFGIRLIKRSGKVITTSTARLTAAQT